MSYAVFYFQVRSNMSGLLQVRLGHCHVVRSTTHCLREQSVQFFGYTLMACYAFFLMLGTVGFYTSLYFVKYLYRNVKLD
jgi:transmembrane 9 superfamily protein 1